MKQQRIIAREVHHAIGLGLSTIMTLFVSGRALRAQSCPPAASVDPETGVVEGRVSDLENGSRNAAVSFDGQGRFIAAWQGPPQPPLFGNDIFVLRFAASGQRICDPASLLDSTGRSIFQRCPSVAMNAAGEVLVGAVGHGDTLPDPSFDSLFLSRFNFDTFTIPPVTIPDMDFTDFVPSVGIAGGATPTDSAAWTKSFDEPDQGHYFATSGTVQPPIRTCGGGLVCFVGAGGDTVKAWTPVVAQRDSDGAFIIAWGEAEDPTEQGSSFDIRMQMYQADGTEIGSEVLVNAPSELGGPELPLSDQTSPAVSIDDNNNIVCVWTANSFDGCTPIVRQVFARRFAWNQDPDTAPMAIGDPFVVNSDPNAPTLNGTLVNPTVALTQSSDPSLCGSFVIAWNALNHFASPSAEEVRAQYFGPTGEPIASEFRVSQDTSETGNGVSRRRLGRSASHTIDYSSDGKVVAVWTTFDSADNPVDVHFTLLPSTYPQYLEDTQGPAQLCIKADVNADGTADVNDIEPFVDVLLGQPGAAAPCVDVIEACRADTNCDAAVNGLDIQPFVDLLLGGTPCSGTSPCATLLSGGGSSGESFQMQGEGAGAIEIPAESPAEGASSGDATPQPVIQDCDVDGVSDAEEIASGASADCNGDEYPDACNLALAIFTSYDGSANGVPDECELEGNDANANGFLDACEPGGGLPVTGEASTDALVQFYEWSIAQTWGPG